MANFNTLPYEIQQLILQHIDNTKQLGECRRVSKIWDEPAECAMFSRQLLITQNNIKPLYEHLVKKPSKANLIKEILVDFRGFPELTGLLLRLAITPNIEKIASVYNLDNRFYQTLAEMVHSGMKLERLKSVPWPDEFTDIHYKTALLLKDSLEEIEIPTTTAFRPHKIADHLGEFTHLSKITASGEFDTLPQLEATFGGVGNLKEVELVACYFEEANAWTHEQRLNWMKQHVETNKNPIVLHVQDDDNDSFPLIEYFLFKYPNIRQFDYEATGFDLIKVFEEDIDFNVEISRQACLWISRIPKYTMNLNWRHEWRPHYALFAGDENTFRLYYRESIDQSYQKTSVSSLVEQDGKRITQFEFCVNGIYSEEFLDTHVTVLQGIGTFATHMHMHIYFVPPHTVESRVFFSALEVMNRLEYIMFESSGSLESVKLDLPSQYNKRQIDTLEICRAKIQVEVFYTLDQLFHTITTLKLSSCSITPDETNTFSIHMPSTVLGKLSFLSDDLHYYSQQKILLKHDTYLMISFHQKVTLHFKLEPHSSDVQQVSLVEYSSRPRHAYAFKIDCQLLESLELDLGDIHATIDVKKYCEGLGVAFN